MAQTRNGRCSCGAVSFTAPDDPLIVHCCHCSFCQRESGTAFALNFLIESDRVDWDGKTEEILTPSNSGKGQRILRCPTCKVALSSHYPGAGDALQFLRVGTFEDKSGVAPDVHIYTSTKMDWVVLEGDASIHENYYDTRAVWPQDKWDRLKKAMGT